MILFNALPDKVKEVIAPALAFLFCQILVQCFLRFVSHGSPLSLPALVPLNLDAWLPGPGISGVRPSAFAR